MIYSLETDRQVRHCSRLQSLGLQQINIYNDTYSVYDDVLMSCRARLLCLLASCERLSASTAGYQLLISSSPGWAGSPSFPHIHVGPISPRVNAHSCLFVCYSYDTNIGGGKYASCWSGYAGYWQIKWNGARYRSAADMLLAIKDVPPTGLDMWLTLLVWIYSLLYGIGSMLLKIQ